MTIPNTVTITVPASEVREGDYLTGLGNGFVFADPSQNEVPPMTDGRHSFDRGEGYVSIVFHDADGEENELIVGENVPVTVAREAE